MAPKYKAYVQKMLDTERELFNKFRPVHDKYVLNSDNQEELNSIGKEVMSVVKDYEDKLCRQSEVGGYGSYTSTLAEKFMDEVRRHFSHIDSVGIIRKTMAPIPVQEDSFMIKKIDLI